MSKTTQRRRRKQAAERLATRHEDKRFEKQVTRWLMEGATEDDSPELLQRALTETAGTPLEGITAELVHIVGEGGQGQGDIEHTEATLDRVTDWLDRYGAQLDAMAALDAQEGVTDAETT